MPIFQIEMSDGRKFRVEADTQPTPDEVLAHLNNAPPAPTSATGTADAFNKAVGLNSHEPENYATGFGRSLEDTALKTAKGVGEGALSTLNPINALTSAANLIAHPIDTLSNAATGIKRFATDAATGNLDPEAGGQAIGSLLTGAAVGRAGPPVVQGLKRVAPSASLATDVGWGALKGATNNLPIVGPTVKGAIRGARQVLDERANAAAPAPMVEPRVQASPMNSGRVADLLAPQDRSSRAMNQMMADWERESPGVTNADLNKRFGLTGMGANSPLPPARPLAPLNPAPSHAPIIDAKGQALLDQLWEQAKSAPATPAAPVAATTDLPSPIEQMLRASLATRTVPKVR